MIKPKRMTPRTASKESGMEFSAELWLAVAGKANLEAANRGAAAAVGVAEPWLSFLCSAFYARKSRQCIAIPARRSGICQNSDAMPAASGATDSATRFELAPSYITAVRVTLIYPSVGRKENKPYVRAWQMEPLSMAASWPRITPPEIEGAVSMMIAWKRSRSMSRRTSSPSASRPSRALASLLEDRA